MASFGAGNQATEIDFESWSGQEMIGYLLGKITNPKAKTGSFVLEYDGRSYQCRVTVDRMRSPQRVQVTWT
jgi:hypothetical protein